MFDAYFLQKQTSAASFFIISLLYKFLELVTASGDVIKANKKENADLFWAMKGCGSNFG